MTTKEESLSSEALDVVVRLLFQLEQERELDDFYDRLCEACCSVASMERAGLLLYDEVRQLVVTVGSHGMGAGVLDNIYGTLEETPRSPATWPAGCRAATRASRA